MNEQLASDTADILRSLGVNAWEADTGGGFYLVEVSDRRNNKVIQTDGHSVEPENPSYGRNWARLRLAGDDYALMPVDEDNPRTIASAILWDLAQRARNAELGVRS